ncbi:MAG: hypothetical protein A2Y40_02850 [Candidatus Margulisbacteria bacterium GWF2_35_9]|nr:MAG: hypothetical protein A2Y40_02850 [Candidatus Margulisbacteria bacterium GWF2_35_9]
MEILLSALLFGASLFYSGPVTSNTIVELKAPAMLSGLGENNLFASSTAPNSLSQPKTTPKTAKKYIIKYKSSYTVSKSSAFTNSQGVQLAGLQTKFNASEPRPVFNKKSFSNGTMTSSAISRQSIKNKFPARAARASKNPKELLLENYYIIEVPKEFSAKTVISAYSNNALVESIEEDLLLSINVLPNDKYLDPDQNGTWSKGSISSYYEDLWGLQASNLEAAWNNSNLSFGLGIVVAVVDTGVDYRHEDIAENMWVNTFELPNNGIDDDNNGYVDDYYGYDFVNRDGDPFDDHYHGTHVAGTIAAKGNNKKGIIGVASRSKIMAVKGLSSSGSGSLSGLGASIVYAVENGADVINNSWGGNGTSTFLEAIINDAQAMGCVVVNAAGNSYDDVKYHLPANIEGSIAVAAYRKISDQNYTYASFSNFGDGIDVAAPGYNIMSLRPGNASMTSGYQTLSGTSMAAPHVAGLAALILANKPYLTVEEVIKTIKESSTYTSSIPAKYQGAGIINAYAALTNSKVTPPWEKIEPPILVTINNQSTAENQTITFKIELVNNALSNVSVEAVNLPSGASFSNQTFSWTPSYTQAGSYTLRFKAIDQLGNFDEKTVVLTVANVYQAPVLRVFGKTTANEMTAVSIGLFADNTESGKLTFSAIGLPLGSNFHEGSFSWEPNYTQSGTYPITFVVTDGLGEQASTVVNLEILNVNRAPVLGFIPMNIDTGENKTIVLQIDASDPDDDEVSLECSGLPTGATFINNVFAWTPTYQQSGTYNLRFILTDSFGAQTQKAVSIVVKNMNRIPTLVPIEDKITNENLALSFTISATDEDGDPLSYFLNGIPNGASLINREFTWTPTYQQAGTYPVTLIINDGQGGQVSESFNLLVNNIYQPPVLLTIGNKTINENQNIRFQVCAPQTEESPLRYTLTLLPEGASFENQEFNWTPTYQQSGTYALSASVSDELGGTDVQTIQITVTNINRLPVIDAISNQTILENQLLSFNVHANDPDGEIIQYSVNNLPKNASFKNEVFSWTPDYTMAGSYTVTFIASDSSGEVAQTNVTLQVIDVNRLPTFTNIKDYSVNENQMLSVPLSATDPDNNTLSYKLFSGPAGASLTNQTIHWRPTYQQAGTYPIVVEVNDGHSGTTQAAFNIIVKNVYTVPVLAPIGNKTINENQSLSFKVQSTETESGSVTYSTSMLPAGAIFADQIFTWIPTNQQAGTYSITFTVSDNMGGKSSETIIITVVNENRLPVIESIPNKTINENEALRFQVKASDLDNELIRYSVGILPPGATFKDQIFTWTPSYQQAGSYNLVFSATDSSGGISQLTVTVLVHNINRLPVITPIQDQMIKENQRISFPISASDADGEVLTYALDNIPLGANFANQIFSWTPSYTQAGIYPLTFTVKDATGGSAVKTIQLNVANSYQTPKLNPVLSRTILENELVQFSTSATETEGTTLSYSIDGLPKCAIFANNNFSWIPDYTQAGVYPLSIKVVDSLGGQDIKNMTIAVRDYNRYPVFVPLTAPEINENETISFQISASDPDGDTVSISVIGLQDGASFSNGLYSWTPSYIEAGVYNLIFTAQDGKGGSAQTAVSVVVKNVNHLPVMNPLENKTLTENQSLSIFIQASDADNDALSYFVTGLPAGASFSNQLFSWTPTYQQAGEYPLTFTVADPSGGTSQQSMILTVLNNYQLPILATIGNKTINENQAITFTLSASDTEGATLTYSIDGLPAGATFSNHSFNWTPDYQQSGTYNITARVSDGVGGTDSKKISIMVINSNRSPIITPLPTSVIDENQAIQFSITANDPDKEPLTYSISNLPAGATFNGSQFSWTPNFTQAGYYYMTVSATDPNGSIVKTGKTIVVNNVNRLPVITPLENIIISENQVLSFQVSATDIDGEELSYSLIGRPSGASFANQVFSWIPNFSQAGSYPLTFKVTDKNGGEAEASITVSVANVYVAPTLELIGDKEVLENSVLSFTINASGTEQNSIRYEITGLPAGASFINKTFHWQPSYTQSGTYPITIKVGDALGGYDEKTVIITVINVNQAPIILAPSIHSVNENQLLSFQITASDPDGDSFTYGIVNKPNGATFINQGFRWTPTYKDSGSYLVTFTATDSNGKTSQSQVQITVLNVNREPVLDDISDQEVNEDQMLTVKLRAIDPDNEILKYVLVSGPSGCSITNEDLHFRPSFSQAGSYQIKIKAVDPFGLSSEKSFALKVNNINRPPYFSEFGHQIVIENQKLSFFAYARDDDGETVQFKANGLPEGAKLTPQSTYYIFEWNPNFSQQGEYPITFIATDGIDTVTKNIIITVKNVNRAPTIEPIRLKMVKTGETLSFQAPITDPDNDPLNITLEGLPPGASFSNGAFIWTPSSHEVGIYRIKLSVSDGPSKPATRYFHVIAFNETNDLTGFATAYSPVSPEDSTPGGLLYIKEIVANTKHAQLIGLPAGMLPVQMDMYQLMSSDKNHHSYIKTISRNINQGNGAWLLSTQNVSVFYSPDDTLNNTLSIGLTKGWNLISNPTLSTTNWQDLMVIKNSETYSVDQACKMGLILKGIHTYIGNTDLSDSNLVIEPWKAYYVYANEPVTIVFPMTNNFIPNQISSKQTKLPVSLKLSIQNNAWVRSVRLVAGDTDLQNEDIVAPPIAPEQNINIVAINDTTTLKTSIKNYNSNIIKWDIQIPSAITQKATLQWQINNDETNKEWQYYLVDTFDNRTELINADINLDLVEGNNDYQIMAVSIEAAAAGISGCINYPNPFNPDSGDNVMLDYALSSTMSGKVQIYTLQGKLIRSVDINGVNGTSGSHPGVAIWDGKNEAGNIMPSDVYLYLMKLTASDGKQYKKTGKILLWK